MLIYKKIKYSEIPEVIQNAVINWDDSEIRVDDSKLTAPQIAKMEEYLTQNSFKKTIN